MILVLRPVGDCYERVEVALSHRGHTARNYEQVSQDGAVENSDSVMGKENPYCGDYMVDPLWYSTLKEQTIRLRQLSNSYSQLSAY